jgi:hypothetical protein
LLLICLPLPVSARFTRLFCELRSVDCAPNSLTSLLGNAKFVNFCGQPGARLDVDQSIYGKPNALPPWILRFMKFALFGSFDVQSKAIHRIWVDKLIVQPRWKNFIDRLTTEWNGYTIYVSCNGFHIITQSMTISVHCDACC